MRVATWRGHARLAPGRTVASLLRSQSGVSKSIASWRIVIESDVRSEPNASRRFSHLIFKEQPMSTTTQDQDRSDRTNRRAMLRNCSGAAALGLGMTALGHSKNLVAQNQQPVEHAVKNGRIKQSIVYWCFEKYWNMDQAAKVARDLGCESIELMAPQFFPTLKQNGLTCAIGTIDMSPDPPFVRGFNNPKYREKVLKATT